MFRSILSFALHQLVGSLGVIFVAPFVTYSIVYVLGFFLRSPLSTHQVAAALTETPGFPIQAAFGFAVGAQIGFRFKQQYGCWAWVLPFVVLFFAFVRWPISAVEGNPLLTKASYFFGHGCQPRFHCFTQLLITLPAIAAAAYSIGTFVALKARSPRGAARL
jgi:hypothetical protein